MTKRKVAARSDGHRAPSASASGQAPKAPEGPRDRVTQPDGGAPPSEDAPSPPVPSSLGMDPRPSAARSGRAGLEERRRAHHETGPAMTAGDIDADWESAYSVGDEAPGGDNPTPGQTVVEDIGRALGVEYRDGEELQAADKIQSRDRHRWELDPGSAEDYAERTRGGGRRHTEPSVKNEE
jgi:hypothetical protein